MPWPKKGNEIKKEIYRVQDEQHKPRFTDVVQMQEKYQWITLCLRPSYLEAVKDSRNLLFYVKRLTLQKQISE